MEQVCTARLRELTADNGYCKMPRYPLINATQKNNWGHLWSEMGLTLKWPPKVAVGAFCSNFVAALRIPVRLDISCELCAGR